MFLVPSWQAGQPKANQEHDMDITMCVMDVTNAVTWRHEVFFWQTRKKNILKPAGLYYLHDFLYLYDFLIHILSGPMRFHVFFLQSVLFSFLTYFSF